MSNELLTIRNLYRPLQPSSRSKSNVQYEEIIPKEDLLPFIYCYWHLSTESPLQEPYSYKVVADGCIDIFFEVTSPESLSVMGFCRNYVSFDLGHSFNYIGIRFLPTMFPQIFKVDAHNLLNNVIPLQELHQATAEYIVGAIKPAMKFSQMVVELNDHFNQLIQSSTINTDHRLYDAIQCIYEKKGQVNLSRDINTGISPRQLRRLFRYYIGDTAKAFSKVVRFQHILSSIRNLDDLKSDRIYLDNGYYDQAHFIKDFRNFYGVTPTIAFG